MSTWGRSSFGDPCRGCGYSWSIDLADAQALVARVPSRLGDLLVNAGGDERHPTLSWSVRAYVAHIGDNLRIWAERIAVAGPGRTIIISTYDENALARARAYDGISLRGALWTLERSSRDWVEAVTSAPPGLVMEHPERGAIQLTDIIRTNAHDAAHHIWDIERALAIAATPGR